MLEFETLEAAEAHLIAAGLKPVGVADWLRADDGADGGIYEVEVDGNVRYRVEIIRRVASSRGD
jgi:hypothetical protein